MRSTQPADREIVAKTAVVFPDQGGYGTHVNISGAGVLKSAPHKENALKFLEYLASNDAQRYFADGNNEWPVVPSVEGGESRARRVRASSRSIRCRSRPTARTPPPRSGSPIPSIGGTRQFRE